MTPIQDVDPLLGSLYALHAALGPVGLFVVLVVLYLGVTSALAWSEVHSERYSNVGNVPFFKNFSTLADFAFLDPLLIVLIVRSTSYMLSLPSRLEPLVAMDQTRFDQYTHKYDIAVASPIACVTLLTAALVAWAVYAHSLRKAKKAKPGRPRSRNGMYVGVMTSVVMYLILSYFYRAIVATWYVVKITSEGFATEASVWSYATTVIGRFQMGFGLVAATLAVIVVVFAVHDMWLYCRGRRRMRVIAASLLVASTTAVVLAGSLIGVHDNLALVVDEKVRTLVDGVQMVSVQASKDMATVTSLPVWTLRIADVSSLLLGQVASVLATLFSEQLLRPARGLLPTAKKR